MIDFFIAQAKTVIPPFLVAFSFFILGGLNRAWTPIFGRFGFAISIMVGLYALVGEPQFPPIDAQQTLYYALLLGFFGYTFRDRISIRILYEVMACLIVLGFVFKPLIQNSWSTNQTLGWLVGFTFLTIGIGQVLSILSVRLEGLVFNAIFILIAVALSLYNLFAGSAMVAQLVGVLGAVAGAAVLIALLRSDYSWALYPVGILNFFLLGVLTNSYFFVGVRPAFLASVAMPVVAGLIVAFFMNKMSRLKQLAWLVLLSMPVLLVGLALAFKEY